MSLAPHSFVDYKSDRATKAVKTKTSRNKGNKNKTRYNSSKITKLPQYQPTWLRSLLLLEGGCKIFTFCAIATTLIVYGWTVYVPPRWTEEYHKLMTLEKREREFIEKNEALKNQLATEAEKDSALENPDPTKAIFLEKAPVTTPLTTPTPPTAIEEKSNYSPSTPLGY
ncbi:MAG: hypothetical protein DSM107014_10160 [Gomphosphaeria aponina SAG 52.96 = DSM 107014]|uniref:Uncharacterized protein n=1 Tax=Gomphosphaeria aponina SAG 52.96 = DSM 107014 TaxID=1521640 RepID=A0A941GU21_9CHRO|nr:hypothetical protein [Gomphosphaeria aponina SAG 52.96 = DSM 107014]